MKINRRQTLKGLMALPLAGFLPSFCEAEDRSWQFGGPMMFHNIVINDKKDCPVQSNLLHSNSINKYTMGLKFLVGNIIIGNENNFGWSSCCLEWKQEKYSCRLNDNDNKYCLNYLVKEYGPISTLNYRFYHVPYIGQFIHTPIGYTIMMYPNTVCLAFED